MMQLHWLGKSGDLILLPPNVIVLLDAPYIFTNFEYIAFLEKKKLRTLWRGWGIFKVRVNGGCASPTSV